MDGNDWVAIHHSRITTKTLFCGLWEAPQVTFPGTGARNLPLKFGGAPRNWRSLDLDLFYSVLICSASFNIAMTVGALTLPLCARLGVRINGLMLQYQPLEKELRPGCSPNYHLHGVQGGILYFGWNLNHRTCNILLSYWSLELFLSWPDSSPL